MQDNNDKMLTLEQAFLEVIEYYPNNSTVRAWRHKLKNNSLKRKTMQKTLIKFGYVKVQEEKWALF